MEAPAPADLIRAIRDLGAAGPLRDSAGPGVYLVGGAVRDLLLGGRPTDLDLVTEADPAPLVSALGGKPLLHGRFETATVAAGGYRYDIARARTESYAQPGALPDVAPAGIEEDLRRRDFTVNSIAVALGEPEPGRLIAVPDALEDLEARRLRVLHGASFIDDPTRLLRLARYVARLHFRVEPGTRSLAQAAVACGALRTVSGNRIGAELRLLAAEPDPVAALSVLRGLGLDGAIHPRFGLRKVDDAILVDGLRLLPDGERRDRLALAVAGRRMGGAEFAEMLDGLGFEAADRDTIVTTMRDADRLRDALVAAGTPSRIATAVGGAPAEAVSLAGALGADRAAHQWLSRLRHVGLEIDGSVLLAAGIPEGPAIGRGLRAALAAKLDGEAQGRDAELEAAIAGAGPGATR